jgi:cyclase
VVKGTKFVGIRTRETRGTGGRYNDQGADELTFLDIGASYRAAATLMDVVRRVQGSLHPALRGRRIRSVDDMREAMNAGADKVSVCTAALRDPSLLTAWRRPTEASAWLLSIDAKRVGAKEDGSPSGTPSQGRPGGHRVDAGGVAVRAEKLGAGEVQLNSIDADGRGAATTWS